MDLYLLVATLAAGSLVLLGMERGAPAVEMLGGFSVLLLVTLVVSRAVVRSLGYLPAEPAVEGRRARPSLRRFLLGPPLPTYEMPHQTVGKSVGLAVFASDVLSSVAYATEEMLIVLAVAGTAYFRLSIPLSVAISTLLIVLTISYRQTIFAYPNGGGAYIVARDNLGEGPAQAAGAALLTDYILTVSVSIASGVAQIVSAFPALFPWRVELAVAAIVFTMLMNLRGVRESGTIFAIPTYFFVSAMLVMLAVGFYQLFTGHLHQVTGLHFERTALQPLTLFLLLRAFSSGAVAVTGTEAVSNGIAAFRDPKSRNAAATLAWMSGLVATMFIGTTVLANRVHALPVADETVISQLARTIYGPGALQLITLAATTLILILAANTAFADFPRLAALVSGDGFLPRQLTYRGRRLVFSSGIAALAGIASVLVVVFRASVSALIPLYAIGVFLSFTMSQAGMVIHWRRIGRLGPDETVPTRGSTLRHDPRWRVKQAINAFGALLTASVVVVLAVTKFRSGAWIVVILIPTLVWIFFRIHDHYQDVRRRLSVHGLADPPAPAPIIHLVLISDVHAAALREVQFVRSLGFRWIALHVEIDPERTAEVRRKWQRFFPDDPLVVLPSPVRDLVGPIRSYVERLRAEHPGAFIHVITSQILMDTLLEQVLHQNTALIFKFALQHIPMVVVSDVGFSLRANGVEGILDVVPGTEATPVPLDRPPGHTIAAAAR
jgi:amino acid transporter